MTSSPADLHSPNRPHAVARFFATEAAGGIVLLAFTAVALVWANSPAAAAYFDLWQTKWTLGVGRAALSESLLHWVNDGLMAVFFFVVGLEIKREVLAGELSSPRGAALPLLAALGGMVVPAGVYVAVVAASGSPVGMRGWAVPMATDIAFALGVLALLGSRVPAGLKMFLTALAVADDLGAVLVIAFFYTSGVSLTALGVAAIFLGLIVLLSRLGVRSVAVYAILGLATWVAVLESGVHATIAGVLVALAVPAGKRVEHALHPWVAFGIMPVFALANAGIALGGVDPAAAATNPVTLASAAGLWFGKPVGVFAFACLAVRTRLARLPAGATWRHVFGVACLCGIGFTMSLFIAGLAFPTPGALDAAKLGVLAASAASAATGAFVLLRSGCRAAPSAPLPEGRH